jgi:hypothetical protein
VDVCSLRQSGIFYHGVLLLALRANSRTPKQFGTTLPQAKARSGETLVT